MTPNGVVMLKTRIITAFLLLFGLLGAIFLLPESGWLLVCALVCGAGAWEWGGLSRFGTLQKAVYAVLMAAACLVVGHAAGLGGEQQALPLMLLPFYLASALLWLLAVPLWLQRKWRIAGVGAAVVVGLIVLLPPALALAHLRQFGAWVMLAALAVCWVADIAAYFSGRAFGRRKLAPGISPGKTWEGVYGAVGGVLVYGFVVSWLLFSQPASPLAVLVLALALAALTAVSIIGDLFESLLKRQAGIKDSGNLLPGHGGVLDRIDSLTSTLPLVGLAALWFAR
jgi:phosphatidate cytidylyltransferase